MNPFYFKTRLVNWFQAIFGLTALSMVVFNIVNRRSGRGKLNYTSMLFTSVLSVPLIVDNIYDAAIQHNAKKITLEASVVILTAMCLVFILGVLYVRNIASKCSSDEECKLANSGGYTSVPTRDGGGGAAIKSNFFVNVFIFSNVLIGFVVFAAIMVAQYALRIASVHDTNNVRELDALYGTIVLISMHALFAALDVVFRKSLWGLVAIHHLIVGVYILSNMIELHNAQKSIETVSILGFLCVSIPLFVINMVYVLLARLRLFVDLDGQDAKAYPTRSPNLMSSDDDDDKQA